MVSWQQGEIGLLLRKIITFLGLIVFRNVHIFYLKILLIFGSVFGSCGFSCLVSATDSTVQDIQEKYKNVFDLFLSMQEQDLLQDATCMQELFLQLDGSSDVLRARLRADRKILKKAKKRAKKTKASEFAELEKDWQAIGDLYFYIKKYRLNYDVFLFHRTMYEKWGAFSESITRDEDIVSLLPTIGITSQDANGLKELIAMIKKDLNTVDRYERQLHTDWIDLRLANYVVRIELIRVRNEAMFHSLLDGVPMKSMYPR